MPADSLRIHIDETLTVIKQTFDDRNVSRAQCAYMYIVCANQLKGQHIAKRSSGAFLTAFKAIPVQVIDGRKTIELPGLIFDYDKDEGVDYLAYMSNGDPHCPPRFTKVMFERTTPSQSSWLYLNKYTEPSASNPFFYREMNNLVLLGLEKVPIKYLELGAYMTIDPLTEIDIDAPFEFPQELLYTLKRMVLDLVRFNFAFPSKNGENTGDDDAAQANVPKVISVNEQGGQQQ